MPSPRQLPLPFPYRPEFTAADFIAAPSNATALAWLDRLAEWPSRRLSLWGNEGSGKTHLLHVWSARVGARYLPGHELRDTLSDAIFSSGALAIDDADSCPDAPLLLHTLNAAAQAEQPVLLAARLPPARWPMRLPDLVSRLRAITSVEIGLPEEDLLRTLLARLLAERQLVLSPGLQEWLLLRLPRTPVAIREAVARLDRARSVSGRAVTRPVAAAVVAEMGERD